MKSKSRSLWESFSGACFLIFNITLLAFSAFIVVWTFPSLNADGNLATNTVELPFCNEQIALMLLYVSCGLLGASAIYNIVAVVFPPKKEDKS